MIKKLFFAFSMMLFATSAVAQLGTSCSEPIPVDSNYEGSITKAGIYWFTAGTYDLPLNVHFKPVDPSTSRAPELMIDLTCEPGVYDDPLVDSLINMVESFNITFPAEMRLEADGDEYDMFVDAMYREQMAKFGVTYNVPAYVRVQFFGPGEISFKPDTIFTSCLNNETVKLGDTLTISANDSERVLLMPYTDWQNDSIQFVWQGSSSATVYLAAGNCDFAPSLSNGYVWASYTVEPNKPYKISNKEIKDAVAQNDGGGIFYAKVISSSEGEMVVETIPMSATQGGAKLLEYGKSISLNANDNSLYCFPKSWTSTQFLGTSEFITKAYFANTSEFAAKDDDASVLSVRAFSKVDGARELSLSTKEMSEITNKATDDYIYVRFQCAQPTTITPLDWDASFCADKSMVINLGDRFSVPARSGNTIYRLLYDDWKGGDLTIKWSGGSSLPVYIADTCAYVLSSTNAHIVKYASIPKRSSTNLTADVVDSWGPRVDADGFLYVRLNPTAQGYATFTSSKPAEVDPEIPVIPTSPCVLNSIELKAGDQIILNLDSAFTVYRINYSQWVATGATLTWTGLEPLHTFVAETCEFAVAPYNKYVHAYVSVPAEGAAVLDAAKLTEMAAYVDEDGYLYIRFLTEKEGVLEVK